MGDEDVFFMRVGVATFAGRIAQSVEHSANNAAVQGSSPCMTNLLPFLEVLS